jgi:hypothetical protein
MVAKTQQISKQQCNIERMLNHGTVLVLGYTVLETRAENTKKVTAWHNKQKEIAPKQDISEDLQEFLGPKLQRAKTRPSRPFLGVLSVAQHIVLVVT